MHESELASMKRVLAEIRKLCEQTDGEALEGMREPEVTPEEQTDMAPAEDTDEAKLLALKKTGA